MITLIPSLILILLATGYITYRTSHDFLNQVLGRASRIQAKAIAHEIESTLARCRRDLLMVAHNFSNQSELRIFFASITASGGVDYCAFGFISQLDRNHWFIVAAKDRVVELPAQSITDIAPDPMLLLEHLDQLKPDEVWISSAAEAEFPFPLPANPNQKMSTKVICFGVPCFSGQGKKIGYLILYLDMRHIRNLLSLYTSPKSPLYAIPRTSVFRYAYFFDPEGWVLFQSEDPGQIELDLTTDVVRSTYKNSTLSKPGLPFAFQPAAQYEYYWEMISATTRGKDGLIEISEPPNGDFSVKEYYLAYAPVFFQGRPLGGIAYIDRTHFTLEAGYKHLNTMIYLSIGTIFSVVLIICIFSYLNTRPIYKLAEVVNAIRQDEALTPIDLHLSGYEAKLLQKSINHLICVLNSQMEEIRDKDQTIRQVEYKEKIELDAGIDARNENSEIELFPEIVGSGPKTRQLKSDLAKAAAAKADVLIIGATGTGKQLTAEAVHRQSSRSTQPFISINCGELSENLLLDTLFGHVKGAFTEARTDRKGAFLEAAGGTLFLDEIQTASLNVQQALLRAVDLRKIKPLGTDKEIDVDVRLICATNIDLRFLIEKEQFRSDLYYRLKVITIHTPSLRDHMENIPLLVSHFIKELRVIMDRPDLGISRGALERLNSYSWPGNIRELKHCITRAAVMSEDEIIQSEDIQLDGPATAGPVDTMQVADIPESSRSTPEHLSKAPTNQPEEKDGLKRSLQQMTKIKLNPRQQKVYPYLLRHKIISRSQYRHEAGGEVSDRTAIYDLKDLVEKGILKKVGSGPSTRYHLIESID